MALKWDWLKEPGARRAIVISLGVLIVAIVFGEICELLFGKSLEAYNESLKVSAVALVVINLCLVGVSYYFQRQRDKGHAEYLEILERIDREINARNREHPEGL